MSLLHTLDDKTESRAEREETICVIPYFGRAVCVCCACYASHSQSACAASGGGRVCGAAGARMCVAAAAMKTAASANRVLHDRNSTAQRAAQRAARRCHTAKAEKIAYVKTKSRAKVEFMPWLTFSLRRKCNRWIIVSHSGSQWAHTQCQIRWRVQTWTEANEWRRTRHFVFLQRSHFPRPECEMDRRAYWRIQVSRSTLHRLRCTLPNGLSVRARVCIDSSLLDALTGPHECNKAECSRANVCLCGRTRAEYVLKHRCDFVFMCNSRAARFAHNK